MIFYDSDETEIRLLQIFFNIFESIFGRFALAFFIYGKVICVAKLKVIQPQPKYKTRHFPNLRKRLLIH